MVASQEGTVECVEKLLDRGADINMQTEVSDVIIHCVQSMQHILRVPCSGLCLCTGILFRQALPFMLFDFYYV